jgi:hypothetical protein
MVGEGRADRIRHAGRAEAGLRAATSHLRCDRCEPSANALAIISPESLAFFVIVPNANCPPRLGGVQSAAKVSDVP